MTDDQLKKSQINGRVRAHHVTELSDSQVWFPTTGLKSNLVLNSWATIVAKLLTQASAAYRIGLMYLEFSNVASPGDPVSAPSFDRTRTVDYYNALSGSSDRDYLRVPIMTSQLETVGDDFQSNQIVFFARSQGTTGVHGKPFAAGSNSVIFGASLVAAVNATDHTQDLLLSSFYFDEEDQQPKLTSGQVGMEWQLLLQ